MKITVSSQLSDFAHVWPALDQSGPHDAFVFQTRDVLEVWLETIGAALAVQPVFVGIHHSDGRPLMLLPLGITRRYGLRLLGFLDGGVSDYNAPVLFPGAEAIDAAAMRRLWTEIAAKSPDFDAAMFDKVPATVNNTANPFQALAQVPDYNSGHLIDLKKVVAGATDPLKALRLKDTTRKWRKLNDVAKIENRIATEPADIARIYAAFMEQKSRRYVETRGVDGFDRPGYRGYYSTMLERFGASGAVQMCALLANDEPIATHWGIVTRDRFYSLMPAYMSGIWARHSPGFLHMEMMIAWSYQQGISIFDLGVGDEAYKLRIANGHLPLFRGRHATSAAGRAYLAALTVRGKIAASPVGDFWRARRERRRSSASTTPTIEG